jgi:hypothetical protein
LERTRDGSNAVFGRQSEFVQRVAVMEIDFVFRLHINFLFNVASLVLPWIERAINIAVLSRIATVCRVAGLAIMTSNSRLTAEHSGQDAFLPA